MASPAAFIHRWFPWLALVLCAALFLRVAALNFEGPILDGSAFRQSQTAISADYLVRDGFKVAYETPVLGPPWSIPFEFPTYQFCVAALVKVTGMKLDPAGRLVSLVFAAAAFWLLAIFVRRATGSLAAGLFAAALGLITPLYAFYSRTFMIESTALCFALALVVATQAFLAAPRWSLLPAVFLAGLLAGLTKATTYAVALSVVAVLGLAALRAFWPKLRAAPRSGALLAATLAAYAGPFVATELWVRYTDLLKSRNEFAHFITSSALHEWNWGTLQQRLTPAVWRDMLRFVDDRVVGLPLAWTIVAVLVGWAFVAARKSAAAGASRLPLAFVLACLAGFFAGPLAFTNLYYRHDYYFFATALYLPALLGAATGVLWDSGRTLTRTLLGGIALPLYSAALVYGYLHAFYPMQMNPDRDLVALGAKIAELTPPDGVILVEGRDWDSSLAYYSHRRTLMNRPMMFPGDPAFQRSLARLRAPIAAMVIAPHLTRDRYYIPRQVRGLRLPMELVHQSPAGDIYLPPPPGGGLRLEGSWRSAGFDPLPLVTVSPSVGGTLFAGGHGVLVHAPGVVLVPRPAGTHTLHLGYGIREDAYTNGKRTDGVVFIVETENSTGRRTRLMDITLDPLGRESDRGARTAAIALPDGEDWIFLITETGPSNECDWSVWRDVRFD